MHLLFLFTVWCRKERLSRAVHRATKTKVHPHKRAQDLQHALLQHTQHGDQAKVEPSAGCVNLRLLGLAISLCARGSWRGWDMAADTDERTFLPPDEQLIRSRQQGAPHFRNSDNTVSME